MAASGVIPHTRGDQREWFTLPTRIVETTSTTTCSHSTGVYVIHRVVVTVAVRALAGMDEGVNSIEPADLWVIPPGIEVIDVNISWSISVQEFDPKFSLFPQKIAKIKT